MSQFGFVSGTYRLDLYFIKIIKFVEFCTVLNFFYLSS